MLLLVGERDHLRLLQLRIGPMAGRRLIVAFVAELPLHRALQDRFRCLVRRRSDDR